MYHSHAATVSSGVSGGLKGSPSAAAVVFQASRAGTERCSGVVQPPWGLQSHLRPPIDTQGNVSPLPLEMTIPGVGYSHGVHSRQAGDSPSSGNVKF